MTERLIDDALVEIGLAAQREALTGECLNIQLVQVRSRCIGGRRIHSFLTSETGENHGRRHSCRGRVMRRLRWKLFRLLSQLGWRICPEPHKSILQSHMPTWEQVSDGLAAANDAPADPEPTDAR